MKSSSSKRKQKTPIRILIVEDDRGWRNHFYNSLTGLGYVIDKASDIKEARFALQQSQPDIILLDMQLGEFTIPSQGWQLLNEIKQPPYGPQIIVVTGTISKPDEILRLMKKKDFDGYEVFDFLPKPRFSPNGLRKIVGKAADRKQALMMAIPSSPLYLKTFDEVNMILVQNKIERLTVKEFRVLERLILGDSNQEIAMFLSLDKETIKTHLKNIYAKLLIEGGRTKILPFAIKIGLVQ